MTGEFVLKTSKGDVQLKLTKKTFYNFEKQRGSGFLSSFADVQVSGDVKMKLSEVMNMDIQVDLARLAQTNTKHTAEQFVEIADPQSLMEFTMFAIEEFLQLRGLKPEEGVEKNP